MDILKNFIDELAKRKLLVYFVIFWGAMLFLSTVYGLLEWGFSVKDISGVIDALFHLSELFAGATLLILGAKLLNTNFLKTIKNERLLAIFLILWASSLLFNGLWSIVEYAPEIADYPIVTLGILGGLAALLAGVTIGLFSWKSLNKVEQ
jgi:hypothetical protein